MSMKKKTVGAAALVGLLGPWGAGLARAGGDASGAAAEITARWQGVPAERGYDLPRWEADWRRILARQPAERLQAARGAESYEALLAAVGLQPRRGALGGEEELIFIALQPCRIVDTRRATGAFAGPIAPGFPRAFSHNTDLGAQGGNPAGCGVPSDAWSIAVTLTVAQAAGPGDFRAYPFSTPAPQASVLNYTTGLSLANTTILRTCIACGFDFEVQADGAAAQLVADVTGFFTLPLLTGDITGIATTPTSGLTGGVDAGAASLAIAPGGVDAARLGDGAVTGPKLAPGAVSASKLAAPAPTEAGQALTWTGSALGWQLPPGLTLPFDGAASLAGTAFVSSNSNPAGTGLAGMHTASTGTQPGVMGATLSGANGAVGVQGTVSTSTPGSFSAGVRGSHSGTGGTGIGVYGRQEGSGWGVYGTTPSGNGVRGSAANGIGVFGTGTIGVLAESVTPGGAALQIYGPIMVAGPTRPAFMHVVAPANRCDLSVTGIDHPLANGDLSALLLVTPRVLNQPMRFTLEYAIVALGPCPANRWRIRVRAESGPDLLDGDVYNVLVIKNP